MEGQKAILNKILSEAKAKVKSINAEAETERNERIADADLWAEKYVSAQAEILKKETESILAGKKLNAELEIKKTVLKAKREVLDAVFVSAYEKLCAIGKKDYLALVKRLVDECADDNDTIVLSSDNVLSESDLDLKGFKAKNLRVSSSRGDFLGGVMLIGQKSDKDLSFARVLEDRKEDLTALAAEILF